MSLLIGGAVEFFDAKSRLGQTSTSSFSCLRVISSHKPFLFVSD